MSHYNLLHEPNPMTPAIKILESPHLTKSGTKQE